MGWVLHSAGRRFGPLGEDELRKYFRAGMVKSVDRISAPGSAAMRAAGEVALEMGETVPEGPPPPPPAPVAAPEVAAPASPTPDAAAEAERQARATRAIAAMQVDLAVLGGKRDARKGSGWLLPVVLVFGLVAAMLVGLNILKKMSAQGGAAGANRADMLAGAPGPAQLPSTPSSEAPVPAPTPAPEPVAAQVAAQAQQNFRQADEFVRTSNWAGLVAHARQWTQAQPAQKDGWQYLGTAYARLGDFNASADALTRALSIDPDDAQMRTLLADVYLQGGRHLEAIGLYKQIVAKTPNDARVWNNYGSALMAAGQTAQAIAALETAVRLDPGFKLAWNSLGNAYASTGDQPRASAAFANAR
jgi:tetratricopeptide (TPR) repeat protein